MAKIRLLFRYAGGKYYALNKLKRFWDIPHAEYREPLLGGGSVFFAKPKKQYNWLNDIHKDLIITFKIIANPKTREALIQMVETEEASKERHYEVKNFKPKSDLERAFRYFYLNRTSFSGKMRSPSWGYRPKRSLPPERWEERIKPCGEKLDGAKLTNLDFEKVILSPSNHKVLMYADPPYYSVQQQDHYVHTFDENDHRRLAKLLEKTEHKFFLTYDDCEEVRNMYDWAEIYPIEFFYRLDNSQHSNGKRNVGAELIISNYKIKS
jgi:DNA adenine methylase